MTKSPLVVEETTTNKIFLIGSPLVMLDNDSARL